MKKIFLLVLMCVCAVAQAEIISVKLQCKAPVGAQCDYSYGNGNAMIFDYKEVKYALALVDDGFGTMSLVIAKQVSGIWLAQSPYISGNVLPSDIASAGGTALYLISKLPDMNSVFTGISAVKCPIDPDIRNRVAYDIASKDIGFLDGVFFQSHTIPFSHALNCPQ